MDLFIKAGCWNGPVREKSEDMVSVAGIMLCDAVKILDTNIKKDEKGHIYLIGAGDSRVYLYRDGFLTQLSTDHEDMQGLLTNCIGAGVEPIVDVKDITSKVTDDDMIVICSDGLTDMVSDDEIEYILTSSPDPLEDLYDRACVNGGADNVSIILAKIGSDFGCGQDGPDDDGRYDAYV